MTNRSRLWSSKKRALSEAEAGNPSASRTADIVPFEPVDTNSKTTLAERLAWEAFQEEVGKLKEDDFKSETATISPDRILATFVEKARLLARRKYRFKPRKRK